jgi:hypothetical protein
MMAAAMARREVCYYTFDDKLLRDEMYDIHTYLTKTNCLGIGKEKMQEVVSLLSLFDAVMVHYCP